MVLKNSFNYVNEFFFYVSKRIRKIYLRSSLYNKKISKINNNTLYYKPSLKILSCLIKYDKKKYNISLTVVFPQLPVMPIIKLDK